MSASSWRRKLGERYTEVESALRVPGGHQVDGLPPVLHTKTVGKRKSRRARTTILLTMINMFLNVIASISVLVNSRFNLSYTSRLLIKIVRLQNDRAISEFYRF